MKYQNIVTGTFLERLNRFEAIVIADGNEQLCHVKNTGRCKELLIPGVSVYLEKNNNPDRKTKYSLIAVLKKCEQSEDLLINMDSQAPNKAVGEWLLLNQLIPDTRLIRPETKYGSSRFDFYIEAEPLTSADSISEKNTEMNAEKNTEKNLENEILKNSNQINKRKIFLEVKGVTLENDGVARFPDAPTLRGIKHIHELIDCVKQGYEAYLIFVIQMKGMRCFEPNNITHKAFGDALQEAVLAGVKVYAYDCLITPETMIIDQEVICHI